MKASSVRVKTCMECQGQQEKLLLLQYNERSNRENRSLLLNWAGDLGPADTDKAGALNREFVSVFTSNVSKVSGV